MLQKILNTLGITRFGISESSDIETWAKEYVAQKIAEEEAARKKELAKEKLRAYVLENEGTEKIGELVVWEKLDAPIINNDEDTVKRFTEDIRIYSLQEFFTYKINVIALRDAIKEGKDKDLMRIVRKHKIEIKQNLQQHFKRNP